MEAKNQPWNRIIGNLKEAKIEAEKQSLKQWNSYFHIILIGTGNFRLSKSYDSPTIGYYLKGEFTSQI